MKRRGGKTYIQLPNYLSPIQLLTGKITLFITICLTLINNVPSGSASLHTSDKSDREPAVLNQATELEVPRIIVYYVPSVKKYIWI